MQAWYRGCIRRSSRSPYQHQKAELRGVKADLHLVSDRARVWLAPQSTLALTMLRDPHLPDDPSDPHMFVSWEKGFLLLMLAQMFFYKKKQNNAAFWRKGLLQMHSQENPSDGLFIHQEAHEAKEVFWLSPLVPILVGKKNNYTCWKAPSSG